MVYLWGVSTSFGRSRDPGDEGSREDRETDEDLDQGFDEEPDSVDTTSPVRGDEAVFEGSGNGDGGDEDLDQVFDEEPDRVERDGDTDREER